MWTEVTVAVTRYMKRSHEEETQWNDCIINAFVKAGTCGNLTAAQMAQFCGNSDSNTTVCPVSRPGLVTAVFMCHSLLSDASFCYVATCGCLRSSCGVHV